MINQNRFENTSIKISANKNLEKQFFIQCKKQHNIHIIPDQLIKENFSIQNSTKPFFTYTTDQLIEYIIYSIDEQYVIKTINNAFIWDNEIIELMVKTMRIDEEATFYLSSFLSIMLTSYKVTKLPLKVKIRTKNEPKLSLLTPDVILYLQYAQQFQESKQLKVNEALNIAQKKLRNDKFYDAILAYEFALNMLYDNPPHFHDIIASYLYLSPEINFFELPCSFNLLQHYNQPQAIEKIHNQRIQLRLKLIETLINVKKHRRACYQILCATCEIMCFQSTQEQDQALEKCMEYLLIIDQSIIKILNPRVLIVELAQVTKTADRIKQIIQRNQQLQQDELYLIQLKYKHYLQKINVNSLNQLTYRDTLVVSDGEIQEELKRMKHIKIITKIQESLIDNSIETQIIQSQQCLEDAIEHYNFGNIKGAVVSSYIGLLILKMNTTFKTMCYYECLQSVLTIDPLSNQIDTEQKNTFIQLRTKLFRRVAMCYECVGDEKHALTFNDLTLQSQLKDNIFNVAIIQKSLDAIFSIYQKISDYDNLYRLAQSYMENNNLKYNEEIYKIFKEFQNKTEVFYKKFNGEKAALINSRYKNIFSSKK